MGERLTAGPWSVLRSRGGYLIDAAAGRVVRGAGGIAQEADAVAIAALPELLESVERIFRRMDWHRLPAYPEHQLVVCELTVLMKELLALRQALRRARGEE
jgi:hypothetical protein